MAKFQLYFEGLCHFVENKDQKALCRMCVVMPEASGHDVIPSHISKLVLKDAVVKRQGFSDSDYLLTFLHRQRVSFEFFKDDQPLPQDGGDFEFGANGLQGIVAMEEIIGKIFADQNLDVVSAFPTSNAQAQILLGRGQFKVDPDLHYTTWNIPGGLNGSVYDTRKEVANGLYLEVDDIDWVRVYIEPFEWNSRLITELGTEPDFLYYDLYPKGDVIKLYAANDCYLKQAIEITTQLMSEEEDSIDYDFRFHYKLLNPSTLSALEKLNVRLPLPSRLGSEARHAAAREKLRSFVERTASVSRNENQRVEWESFLKDLVIILEELFSSSSGCNCLRGGGTTRLFDLEYYILTSVPLNKSSARPSPLPSGIYRVIAP
jgi:hypothetical protein